MGLFGTYWNAVDERHEDRASDSRRGWDSVRPMPRPRTKTKTNVPEPPAIIGWRERVSLPLLGVGTIIAKIDTGARSAALHATDIQRHGNHVDFIVPVKGRNHHCSLPLKGERQVKSSSGHSQARAVVETDVKIGRYRISIEVTLTDRTDMGVPMLLGRSSLNGHFLVHPVRSYVLSPKKRKKT